MARARQGGRPICTEFRSFSRAVNGLLALLFIVVPMTGGLAQPSGTRHVSSMLRAEQSNPAPGTVLALAIQMVPDAGWHTYWKNPGDSGMEPTVQWKLPKGAEAGPLQFPVPDRLMVGGLMNYVYGAPHALLFKLKVPVSAKPGDPFTIRGKLDYLVCTKEECIPENVELALDLKIGEPGAAGQIDPSFAEFRRALPVPQSASARLEQLDGRIRMTAALPKSVRINEPYFFPLVDGVVPYAADQQITVSGESIIVEVDSIKTASSLEGVLRLNEEAGVTIKADQLAAATAADQPSVTRSALAALAAAILGGLLLNFLPCVFPILSLKALSLARSGVSEGVARREALAYTAGAVAICLALGAAVLGFRSSGASLGWAFQLQDPRIILALLLVMVGIGLNLAGLYELPSLSFGGRLASKEGSAGAFWTGALAAFAATPCTGPFMAGALGAALLLPIPAAIAIFAGLGVGLALPFLLIGFVPAARSRLPRPGPWLARVRPLLSVPMFVTALGLAWVLGRQSGVDGMTLGIGAALSLTLLLWWMGRMNGEKAWLCAIPIAITLILAPSLVAPMNEKPVPERSDLSSKFSEANLNLLLQEQRPVFAYFTADWCITCKVNEKTVLQRSEVIEAFEKNNVAVMVGDWTAGDPSISAFLEKQGRSGVPLYIYYKPGSAPVILPQLLNVSTIISTIKRSEGELQ